MLLWELKLVAESRGSDYMNSIRGPLEAERGKLQNASSFRVCVRAVAACSNLVGNGISQRLRELPMQQPTSAIEGNSSTEPELKMSFIKS